MISGNLEIIFLLASLSSCWPPGYKPRQLCLIPHILTYLYKDVLGMYKDPLDLVLTMPSYLTYLLSFSRESESVIQTNKMKLFKFYTFNNMVSDFCWFNSSK